MNSIAGLEATRGCYCLKARKAARALTRHYEEYLRPHGLRATQFSILAALAVRGRPTRVGVLADILGLERTTLTRSAALLASRGWIASERSEDARERLLRVTEKGLRKLETALPAWTEAQRVAGERLGQALEFTAYPTKQTN